MLATTGFVAKDSVPYFVFDHDDDGGFTQTQLATVDDFNKGVAELSSSGLLSYPVSAFLPGAVSAGTNRYVWVIPAPLSFARPIGAYIGSATAPTEDVIVDINVNGTSLFVDQSARLKLTAGHTTGMAGFPDDIALLPFPGLITFDVDQGTSGANLSIVLLLDALTPRLVPT